MGKDSKERSASSSKRKAILDVRDSRAGEGRSVSLGEWAKHVPLGRKGGLLTTVRVNSGDVTTFLVDFRDFLATLEPVPRKVLEMLVSGHGHREIAEKLAISNREIQAAMERARSYFEM
jgi:DNA-directed RNA polymerase specialized sigma24 family protein